MDRILKAIYTGELKIEEAEVRPDPEYSEAMAAFTEVQRQIMDLMPDEKKGLVDELSSASAIVNGIVSQQDFARGYQLGALLMLAVFNGPLNLG